MFDWSLMLELHLDLGSPYQVETHNGCDRETCLNFGGKARASTKKNVKKGEPTSTKIKKTTHTHY